MTLTAPAAPLLCVTSLALWKWRDDLEILRLSLLDGIPSLHLDGPGNLRASESCVQPALSGWEAPKQQMLRLKSLTLAGWRGNLEFLDAMPLLEELSIDKLDSGPSLSPIARLLQLRVVTAEWRVARDIRYEGVVWPPDCTLWCGGSICPTG